MERNKEQKRAEALQNLRLRKGGFVPACIDKPFDPMELLD
jgi:hypothetical protein